MLIDMKGLERELKERRSRQNEIREAIDDYCFHKYGVENFSSLADSSFQGGRGDVGVCLARQISTPNVEHASLGLLADWLTENSSCFEYEAIPMSFVRDAYTPDNKQKKSLVFVPWVRRGGRTGRVYSYNEKIVSKQERKSSSGRILKEIVTIEGISLPEHHLRYWNESFKDFKVFHLMDCSVFFDQCLRRSLEKKQGQPPYFYIEYEGKDVKCSSPARVNGNLIRPSAEWFYLFHLMRFVDGSRIMLSSNDDSGIVKEWIARAIEEIKAATGLEPLLISTPAKVEVEEEEYIGNMNEINCGFFKRGWRQEIASPNSDLPLFTIFEKFSKEVYSL